MRLVVRSKNLPTFQSRVEHSSLPPYFLIKADPIGKFPFPDLVLSPGMGQRGEDVGQAVCLPRSTPASGPIIPPQDTSAQS